MVSGRLADERGLALPFTAGLVLFSVGLVVGGAAGALPMLVAGRIAQGCGAGAIPATAYAAVGRGYPAALRPRMFATMSTAWVVPGLVGPALATLVEHAWSWRLVFLGLLPFVGVALVMAVPALRALDAVPAPEEEATPACGARPAGEPRHLRAGAVLGVGAVLAATSGAPADWRSCSWRWACRPSGRSWGWCRRAPPPARGPATVAVRACSPAAFAADAYVPLAMRQARASLGVVRRCP